MFSDRDDAGRKLLARLPKVDPAKTVVIGLPRGGVPVAAVIAKALRVPLDIRLVRKIGAPGQPELAVGALSDGDSPQVTVNEHIARMFGLSGGDVRRLGDTELPELRRRRALFFGDRPPVPLAGKTVIVVDDGIATGATARASLRLIRSEGPAQIILAVPVAAEDTLAMLSTEVDQVICLETPAAFSSVGAYYVRFDQVPDDVVQYLLRTTNSPDASTM